MRNYSLNRIMVITMAFEKKPRVLFTVFICLVWLTNGLLCKVLNLVPRHQLIVSRILGEGHAWIFTNAIGVAEILIAIWIASRLKSRLCAVLQITTVATMNVLEFILVPDLLLFGRLNILFASFFMALIYIHEFVLTKSTQHAISK